jgi:retinol dehydrogenase 12
MNPTVAGRVAIITGANSGIGFATAAGLARRGARVVMVCRDAGRGEAARVALEARVPGAAFDLVQADLASLSSVRALAAILQERYPAIHVLVNNAGVMLPQRAESADGYELQLAVNHLAPFLLTQLLEAPLAAGAPARVVNVSSMVHRFGRIHFDDPHFTRRYRMFPAYGQSKLALILFTFELAERWAGRGVTANALHPGVVNSNLGGTPAPFKRFMPGPEKGARTSIYLASHPAVEGVTGRYFSACKPARAARAAYDDVVRERLWALSAELTGIG